MIEVRLRGELSFFVENLRMGLFLKRGSYKLIINLGSILKKIILKFFEKK